MFASQARRQLRLTNRRLLCRFNPPARCQWLSSSSSSDVSGTSSSTVSSDQQDKETQRQQLLRDIREANARYEGRIAIQTTADQRGWGLYALTTLHQGDLVMRGTAIFDASPVQTSHSVQLDGNRHAEMDLPAAFINHICNQANVGVKPNDVGAYDFYALRRIDKDQELLWDYETTEYQISGFSCKCGSSTCRGELKGFQAHKEQVMAAYGQDWIAPYLLRSQE